MPRLASEILDQYRQHAAAGLSQAQTAERMGVSRERVRQIANKHEIDFINKRGPLLSFDREPFRKARICACGEMGFVGLTQGAVALFSAADLHVVEGYAWQRRPRGRTAYASRRGDAARGEPETVFMHRAILGGDAPHTDHRDGDGLDNRRGNIRGCTAAENLRNRRKQVRARVPFKGVSFFSGKFVAAIKIDGTRLHLGRHPTPEAAARAYDRAALEHFGAFARTNVCLGLLPPEDPVSLAAE